MADKVLKSSVPACKAASKNATPSRQFPPLHNFSPSRANWRHVSLSPALEEGSPFVFAVAEAAEAVIRKRNICSVTMRYAVDAEIEGDASDLLLGLKCVANKNI